MKSYKLDPLRFKEFRTRYILRLFPIFLLAIIGGFTIILFTNQDIELLTFGITTIIAITVIAFVLSSNLRIQARLWNLYELTIESDSVSQFQGSSNEIILFKEDIKEINLLSNGDIVIKTEKNNKSITISAFIRNRDEVLIELEKLGEINKIETKNLRNWLLIFLLSSLTITAMIIFHVTNILDLMIISGISIIAIFLWSFIEIRLNQNLDKKIKKYSYLMFIVIAKILFEMLEKLGIFGS
jgi:hypothetical protein